MRVEPQGWPVTETVPRDTWAPWLDVDTNKEALLADWWCDVDGVPYCVHAGYVTDWASIPFVLHWLYPPDKRTFRRAALYHDYCYSHLWPLVSKQHADKAFLALLKLDGVPWWRRSMFYAGVRIGGRGGWHRVKHDADPFWRAQYRRMMR